LRIYKGRISFLPANQDYSPKDTSIQIKSNKNNYENNSKQKFVDGFTHLTAFEKPVPNDLLTIDDEFVSFLLVNLPLVGQDYIASPESKLDDGLLYLTFIRKGISKLDLIKVISDSGSGNFLKNSHLEWVCVKAFRLEPLDDHGTIMVDGEKISYGKIQGEILPSFGRALV
jgi:sphingosine kinase